MLCCRFYSFGENFDQRQKIWSVWSSARDFTMKKKERSFWIQPICGKNDYEKKMLPKKWWKQMNLCPACFSDEFCCAFVCVHGLLFSCVGGKLSDTATAILSMSLNFEKKIQCNDRSRFEIYCTVFDLNVKDKSARWDTSMCSRSDQPVLCVSHPK